ncbi:MAG: PAS domain S-box protein [Gallionellaceae bacterium]|nr:PAS domain S-box protein [Gallionellaceae bacterium]
MNSPRKPLRVLFVEDSQDDADLTLFALEEGGFDVIRKRVDTEAAMRAALADCEWDVVVSDFNMPRFDTYKALAILRETDPDIPFIVVSGCIGEENAIALMKQGASDFVMKDKLARLPPAIERELRDAAARREHRLTQEALHEKKKLLKGITASLGEGVFVLDADARLIFMNPEAERLLGWTESELFGKEVHRIIHSHKQDGTPLPESCCGVLWVLGNGGVHRSEDDVFWRKDGSPMPVSITASAITEEGKNVASVAVFQDISQRKLAEWNLLESRRQLRELASHLQSVREEERTRLARELHDELGQMLTGVKLDAKWLAAHLPDQQPDMSDKIADMSKLIDETLDAMRRVAADLRPVMLDDLGLAAAIEWLTEEFTKRTGIAIRLEMDVEPDSLDDGCDLDADVATAVFRIMQECLTNIARHAEAEHVLISLGCDDNKLMLLVTDDGKGMPAADGSRCNSYGITGMRERAHSLGGKLDMLSIPEGGTAVVATIPINPVGLAGAMQ